MKAPSINHWPRSNHLSLAVPSQTLPIQRLRTRVDGRVDLRVPKANLERGTELERVV